MHPYIEIFGLTLPAYGVMLLAAVLTGYAAALTFADEERLELKKVENLFFAVFAAALFGARAFYLIEHGEPLFPELFLFWKGGLDFFGGFLTASALLAVGIKLSKLPFWKTLDVAALSLILAHSVGRLSCWLAGCCYGKPTDLPVGVRFPPEAVAPSGISLYPTQLMEASGNFLGFLILYGIKRRLSPPAGTVAAGYLIYYGTERFFLEFLRATTPPLEGLGLTWNQLVAAGAVTLGILILLWRLRAGK